MVLKTLYSGVDYEAFSNTNSTDVDNYLDFTVDRIHSYNALAYKNTETYVTWDGPNLTIYPTDYFFKGNVLTFRGPISIPNVDTSTFNVDFNTGAILVNIKVNSWRFVFRSISFICDGKVYNFYYNDVIINTYLNMQNFKVTKDSQLAFYRSKDEEPMYLTLRFNFKQSFKSFGLLWFHNLCDNFEINIDIDDSTIPVPTPSRTVEIINKGDALQDNGIVFKDQYYYPDTEFELLDLITGYQNKSKWKALILRMSKLGKTIEDTAVSSIDIELVPAGRLFAEIRTNQNPDFISLGSLMFHQDGNFTHHHMSHPWLPAFTQHAVYNKRSMQFTQNSNNSNIIDIEVPIIDDPIIINPNNPDGNSNNSGSEGSRDTGLINPNVNKAPTFSKDFTILQNKIKNKFVRTYSEIENIIKDIYSVKEIQTLELINQSDKNSIYRLINPELQTVDYFRLIKDVFTEIPFDQKSTNELEFLGSDKELLFKLINPLYLNYNLETIEDMIGSYFNVDYMYTENEEFDDTELFPVYVFENGVENIREYYTKVVNKATSSAPRNKISNSEWKYLTSDQEIKNLDLLKFRSLINLFYKQSDIPKQKDPPVVYGLYEEYKGDNEYRYWELLLGSQDYPYYPDKKYDSSKYWNYRGIFINSVKQLENYIDISKKFKVINIQEISDNVSNDDNSHSSNGNYKSLTVEELNNIGKVVNGLIFPKELLLSLFDYSHISYDMSISSKTHKIEYALFSQYDFLKGIYEPVKRGIVAPNSFINYDFSKIKYPVILFNYIDTFWRSKIYTNVKFANRTKTQVNAIVNTNFNFMFFHPLELNETITFSNKIEVDVTIYTAKELLKMRYSLISNNLKPDWELIFDSLDFKNIAYHSVTTYYTNNLKYLIKPTISIINGKDTFEIKMITSLEFDNIISSIENEEDDETEEGEDT